MSFENKEEELLGKEVRKDKKLEAKFSPEKNDDQEVENSSDGREEKQAKEQEEIDKLRKYINEEVPSQEIQNTKSERSSKLREKLSENLPKYLKKDSGYKITNKIMKLLRVLRHPIIGSREIFNPKKNIEGYENYEELRDKPFIMISNHNNATELYSILPAFDRTIHTAIGRLANWSYGPIRFFAKHAIKGIPVRESFRHLIEKNRVDKFLESKLFFERKKYKKAIDDEKKAIENRSIVDFSEYKDSLKKMLGILGKGEIVLIFPEGVRVVQREKGKPKEIAKGYNGAYELAKAAEKLIGMRVPILPVGVSERLKVGKPFYYEDCVKDLPDGEEAGDFLMKRIAELLPENVRGIYKTN